MSRTKTQFATRLGVIATTVGSAVGLGNIWRFPYEAGMHGGGAFLLIDLFFIFIIGIPVICAEFIIGRHTGTNVRGAFAQLAPKSGWTILGYGGILASTLILGFYSVVAGWTLEYIYQSIIGFGSVHDPDQLHARFDAFSTSDFRPVMWTVVFLLINFLILVRGVEKGIERMSNILMPTFFVILLAFCINSLMLPKAAEGLTFLFKPEFSKITPDVLLGGMGQAFFSLSLGLGCLITYSSYFDRRTKLLKTACTTAALDTLVSILAGIIIFPAVFSFGQEPAAGPRLVFEVLPSIFSDMPGGMIWSTLFFVLLFLASLTSTVSMSEISIAYYIDELNMSRRKATLLNLAIALVLGSLCALSFGSLSHIKVFGMNFFNLFDFLSSNVLLPLGGMFTSIFVGWKMKRQVVYAELDAPLTGARRAVVNCIIFCLRWIAPVCILMVFISGLM